MKTLEEIKVTSKIVLDILRTDTRSRNDDKYLTFRVLQQKLHGDPKGQLLSISLSDLKDLPAFETIKRVRAQIQNVEKKFLPTEAAVRRRRRIREDDFAAWASGKQETLF